MEQDQPQKSLQPNLLQSQSSKSNSQINIKIQELSPEEESFKENYLKNKGYLLSGNIFNFTFFRWITPLLSYGNKIFVSQDAIPSLLQEDNVEHDFEKLNKKFRNSKKSSVQGLTLTKVLAATFRKTLMKIFILTFCVVFLQMYSPILTNQIMDYIKEDSQQRDSQKGYIIYITVFLVMFVKNVSQGQMYFNFGLLGLNTSNTINLMVYTKSLKYPALCQKKHTIAEIINYTQVDAQRLTDIGFYMAMLFLAPIQMIVGIYLMVSFLGYAFLTGIAVMIAVSIFTFFIQKYSAKVNDKLLKSKDQRVKLTEQVFNVIKFVKTNAMQKYFFRKINKKRNDQLNLNKSNQMMYVLMYLVYFATSPLVMSLTFATFTWMGNEMNSNVAFTTLLIFRLLQFPMTIFPIAIGQVIQIWSSLKRIQEFLSADEIDQNCVTYSENNQKQRIAIKISNGTFEWGLQLKKNQEQEDQKKQKKEKQQKKKSDSFLSNQQKALEQPLIANQKLYKQSIMSSQYVSSIKQKQQQKQKQEEKPKTIIALYDLNLSFQKQKFTMILGDIGSGKSSLLYSILNQMHPVDKSKAKIQVNGTIAFVSQKAWIMSSTVKQNIVFTLPYNPQKFERALYFSSLKKDIQNMTDGQQTQIGQKGVNLSGGQKARISFARSLYSDKDIYLLDDVISAVDVHVGKFLMKQTIMSYLKGKTVILATHAISFAEYADEIIIMKKGRIIQKGTYRQVSKTEQFQQLNKIQHERQRKKTLDDQQQQMKDQDQIDNLALKFSKSKRSHEKSAEKVKSVQQIQAQEKKFQTVTEKLIYQLMLPEEQQKGSVDSKIYKSYVSLNGGYPFALGLAFSLTVWIILDSLSNIEMQKWCEDPQKSQSHLYFFLGFSLSGAVFAFVRVIILVFCGIKLGSIIHKKMIKSLLYASIPNFYNRVPIGRIINRLTKDLRVIDQNLAYTIEGFLGSFFSMIGAFVICVYASSLYLLFFILFMIIICVYIKRYYMKTQRQVVRLQSISNSPVVSGLMSTVNGLAVIRSYRLQKQFIQEQIQKINRNKKIRVAKTSLQQWFAQRLSLLSFVVNMGAIAFCLLSSNQNASLAGLLMSYAVTLNNQMIGVMLCLASVQTQMVSFQRIFSFMEIQPQPGYKQYCKKWKAREQQRDTESIKNGAIKFKDYAIKYRQDLPFVLRNVNLDIKQGEKVGIVGRTGAGKSTIVSCLLRILQPSQGKIQIDGKNIMNYHLRDLRSCITMIQQQPTLINGTFQQNLDPSHKYTKQELNSIIKQCNLEETINERGGIQSQISNDSLSVGQKQLLCICRAFLKKSKIVLIDEATANIDMKNDALIQEVIKNKFTQSTVLTIAHRLSTLKNADKILVLGQGKVLQWGPPNQLLKKQDGIYRAMIDSHNEDFLK